MFTTFEFLSNGAAKNRSSGKQIGREQKSFVDLKSDDYEEQRMRATTVVLYSLKERE
tara:strand:+ start:283 stop:453 length:171 start_codon:yes stop_codon:yes gene_type:complete